MSHCPVCGAPDRRLLTTREVAEVLGCCPRTVRNRLDSGRLAGIRLDTQRRVSHASLHRYLGLAVDEDRTMAPMPTQSARRRPEW